MNNTNNSNNNKNKNNSNNNSKLLNTLFHLNHMVLEIHFNNNSNKMTHKRLNF